MNKICLKCKVEKPVEEFSFSNVKDGIRKRQCKKCINEYNEKYKLRNSEGIRDKWRKASRKYNSVDKRRNKTLSSYGLDVSKYNEMHDEQDGKCKICSSDLTLVVDHCHDTGNIRGLLCNKCNVGLGCFSDDINLLEKALDYLKISIAR